mgnify:FL=1
MRVAITGAAGLLGQELAKHFQRRTDTEVIPLTHADLDITVPDAARAVIRDIQPDALINCAVIISVDACERDPKRAYAVNRDGAEFLMEALAGLPHPATFVEISSSEVFGGWEDGEFNIDGYREDDERHPISVYQKSKAEAEDLVKDFATKHPGKLQRWFIVRAAWLYGEGRPTFVEQFVELLQKREEITAAADQWRSPTWTRDFTEGFDALLNGAYSNGVYHIVNEVKPGEATVMDVVEEIRAYLRVASEEVKLNLVSRKDFFKIPRAPSNVLLNTKLPKLRPWREAIREYLGIRYPLPSTR